jgi:hypothetical protein
VAPQTLAAEQITSASAKRITDADAEAHESNIAFAAGKFGEYFEQKSRAVAKEIGDEYDRIIGSAATEGDGQAGG